MNASLSNNPPADANPLLDRLAEQYAALVERADELTAAVDRMPATLDDVTHDKAAAFAKQLRGHRKICDDARVVEKEPYLAGGKTVDGWFGQLTAALDQAAKKVADRITAYLRAKEAAERTAREAEAKRAREEAERRAAEMRDERSLEEAVAAQETAELAAEAAHAPTADLARTRTSYGVTSTLRTEIGWEVTAKAAACRVLAPYLDDAALDKACRAYVRANKAAVEHMIAGRAEMPEGLRFFHDKRARVA